jgi:TolA-binding protein
VNVQKELLRGPDSPEDLSAMSRRGPLAESDRRRLELSLASSPANLAMHRAGEAFDEIEPVPGTDDALVARIALAARDKFAAGSTASTVKRSPRWTVWLAAAAVLLVAAASGAVIWRLRAEPRVAPQPMVVAPAPRPEPAAVPPAAPVALAAPETAGSPRAAARPADKSVSAADLFSSANAARKRGDASGALALYGRLQSEHPTSDEALLSHVLAARVRLGRGEYAPAIRQFDRYLERAPGGSLAEEALHGKASAYEQTGQSAQEQAVWRELLRRFPSSVYAVKARERLAEKPSQ